MTFLTPEATNALDQYFNKRRVDGEIITPERPVFREKYQIGSQPVRAIRSTAIAGIVKRIIEKAGRRDKNLKKDNRYAVPANHGFRHRFNEIIK